MCEKEKELYKIGEKWDKERKALRYEELKEVGEIMRRASIVSLTCRYSTRSSLPLAIVNSESVSVRFF